MPVCCYFGLPCVSVCLAARQQPAAAPDQGRDLPARVALFLALFVVPRPGGRDAGCTWHSAPRDPGSGRGLRTRTAAAAERRRRGRPHHTPPDGARLEKGRVFVVCVCVCVFVCWRRWFPESWVLRFHGDATWRQMMLLLQRLLGGAEPRSTAASTGTTTTMIRSRLERSLWGTLVSIGRRSLGPNRGAVGIVGAGAGGPDGAWRLAAVVTASPTMATSGRAGPWALGPSTLEPWCHHQQQPESPGVRYGFGRRAACS